MGHHHSSAFTPPANIPPEHPEYRNFAAAARRPRDCDCYRLTPREIHIVTKALIAHGSHIVLQHVVRIPCDTIGLILEYCPIGSIINFLSTCKTLHRGAEDLWAEIAQMRCEKEQYEELSLRPDFDAEYHAIAKWGVPFFFSPHGPNEIHASSLGFSADGKEVWSTQSVEHDITVLCDRPLNMDGRSAITFRVYPVTVEAKQPPTSHGRTLLRTFSHSLHSSPVRQMSPSPLSPSKRFHYHQANRNTSPNSSFTNHSFGNRSPNNLSFGSRPSNNHSFGGRSPNNLSFGSRSPNNLSFDGRHTNAEVKVQPQAKPQPQVTIGLTHVYQDSLHRPQAMRLFTLASFCAAEGHIRKGGAPQAKRQPWKFGDDITMMVNCVERSCMFWVNGQRVVKIWDLNFEPGQPVWFFVRYGSNETYHCKLL